MANESYWNKEFAQVEVYVDKADRTRPHTFHDQAYGGFNNQGSTAPIANIHYPGPDGYKVAARGDRPMVYGEYCHLNVYNRSELVTDPGVRCDWALALRPAWENMYATRGVLGGSIWSGIDDIFQLPDGRAVGYGAWGPIDGWRRPKPEYWDMKKCYSPVHLLTRQLVPGQPAEVEVENRHAFSRTFWNRRGQWSVYPADHIGRPEGEALMEYPEVPDSISPRQAPSWPWSHDGSALGSNDFRATRRNIRFAGLAAGEGECLTALSDGTQHWRAWRHGDGVRFLVADFATAGNEMFLESYYAPLRRPLRKGDHIKGRIVLYAGPADASIGAAVPHEQK